jgi:hypothetical protein
MGMGGSWMGRRSAKWLYATAVFELLLAGVFGAIALSSPLLRDGFLLTAGILGVVGIGLLVWARKWSRSAAESDRIRTQGVPGQAQITGMRQTGVHLNEQPQVELQLQVTTDMHGAYPVTLKEYVPLMLTGALSSGRPLPVKVDPADPQRVVIEWESALGGMGGMPMGGMPMGGTQMGGMSVASAMPQGDPEAVKQQLLATGVPGIARVVSSTPTGQTDAQGRPVYSMMMQVEIEGRPPIQAPAMVGVPPERADQLEVGDSIPVKADPNNPMMMAVDWDNA